MAAPDEFVLLDEAEAPDEAEAADEAVPVDRDALIGLVNKMLEEGGDEDDIELQEEEDSIFRSPRPHSEAGALLAGKDVNQTTARYSATHRQRTRPHRDGVAAVRRARRWTRPTAVVTRR